MNYCTWKGRIVTLADGREVKDDHPDYRAECEARHVLAKAHHDQVELLERIGQRRGADALASLKATMTNVEPAYVLDLPNKPQRLAYLAKLEFVIGQNHADQLRARVLELHRRRKAAEVDCKSNAA